ncbi:hypothetical protein GCM10010156_74670 [Planobispora rosea]|uniref:Uncharacterized protein n=2 Tax=Planobispora rosea TaxID=35762 RepID=A0A8J3SAH9_PLARO|nr:hypothetical protein [Planobispora rosea]GGT06224.1 hypothetical protein GCM10010156_74670 [Planobispora rosea]GIH89016.1 hypothetical protein Pro02_74240 [Planobispora rosea]
MNDETAALLFDVLERLQQNIAARGCPAIVALEGEQKLVLSDYDYLRDPRSALSFETRAAARAQEIQATRWVFAVPLVWVAAADTVYSRAVSNHPLREGEQETITWMSFDEGDGVDYGRVPYARRPSGEPVFDDPEMFAVGVRAAPAMPGRTLLHRLFPAG